jgi:toxin ParE1/3/4
LAKARLSATAKRDLKDIWKYIAADNVAAADHLLDQLESTALMLARSPLLGRSRDELALGMRSFPVGNYLLFYLPIKNGIMIVRVLSGYRDLDSLFEVPDNGPK